MLQPEPYVIVGRYGIDDAQTALNGALTLNLGYFQCGWYGTNVQDERGCFGIVSGTSVLADSVGDVLNVKPARSNRAVSVYIIGTQQDLDTDMAITRRAYLAISRLDVDPIEVIVQQVAVSVVPGVVT